jgi:alpha-L-rhamnosidase
MNSFSHYAFGAVCEWMFQTLAGIDTEGVGYRRIIIAPKIPSPALRSNDNQEWEPISWVRAEYESPAGRILSQWKRLEDRILIDVTIPANTDGTIYIPAAQAEDVTESGKVLGSAEGIRSVRAEQNRVVLEIESGSYRFQSKIVLEPTHLAWAHRSR